MRYKTTAFFFLIGILTGFGVTHGETGEKIISANLSKDEEKAVRIEMIEMDITVRTIASMISLNKPDRLEVLFQRLKDVQLSSSIYHKNGISGAIKKWKNNGLIKHLENIQSESASMVEYLHSINTAENTAENKPEVQWSMIYDANRKILENCQGCHISSQVDLQKS